MDTNAPIASNADLFRLVWLLEKRLRSADPVGTAASPHKENIRFRQSPHLFHASAEVAACEVRTTPSASAEITAFAPSLIGPNGALPQSVTEQAIKEQLAGGAQPLRDLLDLVGGRFIALFYRAWTQGTPAYVLDDPRFRCAYRIALACVHGSAPETMAGIERQHVAWFLGYSRPREFLARLLQASFRLSAEIVQFVGAWLPIPTASRSRLGFGALSGALGRGLVIGSRSWDRRFRVRVRLRGGSFHQYEGFLPGGTLRPRMDALFRGFARSHLEWDVDYQLATSEVPPARFGKTLRLGFTTWLGKPRGTHTSVRLPKALYNLATATI